MGLWSMNVTNIIMPMFLALLSVTFFALGIFLSNNYIIILSIIITVFAYLNEFKDNKVLKTTSQAIIFLCVLAICFVLWHKYLDNKAQQNIITLRLKNIAQESLQGFNAVIARQKEYFFIVPKAGHSIKPNSIVLPSRKDNIDIAYPKYCYSAYMKSRYFLAMSHCRHSAKFGNPFAMFMVGIMYFNGEGVKKNTKKAFDWYLAAAKHGYDYAQLTVALFYFSGKIVKKDLNKAVYWHIKARKSLSN
jgi:membrane protein implicated in regulation of membrane protease activity